MKYNLRKGWTYCPVAYYAHSGLLSALRKAFKNNYADKAPNAKLWVREGRICFVMPEDLADSYCAFISAFYDGWIAHMRHVTGKLVW